MDMFVTVCSPMANVGSWLFEASATHVHGCSRLLVCLWLFEASWMFVAVKDGPVFMVVRDFVDVYSWLFETWWMCWWMCICGYL